MAIEITHRRMSNGGYLHEHIVSVQWKQVGGNEGVSSNTTAEMVDWIDNKNGLAYVGSGPGKSTVSTVHPDSGEPYLRTHADGVWNNNLLALPLY